MNKEDEKKFLYNNIINDINFKEIYKDHNIKSISYEESIEYLINYILYSEFDPYLDKRYLDLSWLYNKETNKIYNLDDIFDEYVGEIKDLEIEEKREIGE